jgi:hypothetical protein
VAKEYRNWRVRVLDLPAQDGGLLTAALAAAPEVADGDVVAWRAGEWYRRVLLPLCLPDATTSAYRMGGTYVVIGGAGGVGEAWSEWVIRRYRARVVWIGRRAEDDAIRARCARLAEHGPRPLYLQVDASDGDALARALQTLPQAATVHGVVHSALVLDDCSLANMAPSQFAAGLSSKADVCGAIAHAFAGDALHQSQHLLGNAAPAVGGQDHHIVHIDQRAASEGGKPLEAVHQTDCVIPIKGQHTESLGAARQFGHQMGAGVVAEGLAPAHRIAGVGIEQLHQQLTVAGIAPVGLDATHGNGVQGTARCGGVGRRRVNGGHAGVSRVAARRSAHWRARSGS